MSGSDKWREIQHSKLSEENGGHVRCPLSFVELKPNDDEPEGVSTATGQLLDLDGVTSEVTLEDEAEVIPLASTEINLGGIESEVTPAVHSDGVTTETVTQVMTEVKFLTNVSLVPEEFEGKWTTWKSWYV